MRVLHSRHCHGRFSWQSIPISCLSTFGLLVLSCCGRACTLFSAMILTQRNFQLKKLLTVTFVAAPDTGQSWTLPKPSPLPRPVEGRGRMEELVVAWRVAQMAAGDSQQPITQK